MPTKTVAEKLAIKPGTPVWLSHADRAGLIQPAPESVGEVSEAAIAIVFADDAASLRAVLTEQAADITKPANVWVLYPKGNKTDINRDTLWPILGEYGLRPNGQIAVDDVWSALRFRPLKPGEEPFAGGR
ncbi:hypothetical protein J5X84_12195 [Streptosporangiaceae bacterium NEAU-GS5]|nr:hypothetical protein [Streptosporangiaceae bacterium NEAU-GS5]